MRSLSLYLTLGQVASKALEVSAVVAQRVGEAARTGQTGAILHATAEV